MKKETKKRRIIFDNGVSCIAYGTKKEIIKNNRGIFTMFEIINDEEENNNLIYRI